MFVRWTHATWGVLTWCNGTLGRQKEGVSRHREPLLTLSGYKKHLMNNPSTTHACFSILDTGNFMLISNTTFLFSSGEVDLLKKVTPPQLWGMIDMLVSMPTCFGIISNGNVTLNPNINFLFRSGKIDPLQKITPPPSQPWGINDMLLSTLTWWT